MSRNFLPNMQAGYFLSPGLQNAGQFLPYQLPLQNYAPYPDIIGDGEVTSLVLPNGSFQYIFIPTLKRDPWPPYALSPNVPNPNWNLNIEAWLVRNVSNPLPNYGFNVQLPKATNQQICSSPLDFRLNVPALGYHNKFHYDQCTSTTDLHYFYPSIRYSNPLEKYPSVQNDTPIRNTVYTYEVQCNRPCYCEKQKEISKIDNRKHIDKCMSVDNIQGSTQTVRGKIDCMCSSQKLTSDKIISTYKDQATDPQESVNENCMTVNKKDSTMSTESSKGYKGRRLRGKYSPIKIIGVCESATCYCSNTTEQEIK